MGVSPRSEGTTADIHPPASIGGLLPIQPGFSRLCCRLGGPLPQEAKKRAAGMKKETLSRCPFSRRSTQHPPLRRGLADGRPDSQDHYAGDTLGGVCGQRPQHGARQHLSHNHRQSETFIFWNKVTRSPTADAYSRVISLQIRLHHLGKICIS